MIGDPKRNESLFRDWNINECSKDVTTPSVTGLLQNGVGQ